MEFSAAAFRLTMGEETCFAIGVCGPDDLWRRRAQLRVDRASWGGVEKLG